MNTILLVIAISTMAVIIILFFFFKARNEAVSLKTKYAPIITVEGERDRIKLEIESLAHERDSLKAEFLDRKKRLTAEYDKAHNIFEKLQKEISLLEETADMMDFGIYKPHFDFDTPDAFREQLGALRENEKDMIRMDRAVICDIEWTVQGSKAAGKRMTKQNHKLMLRAFNGECDAALAKVRWDNIIKMEERIKQAFEKINKSGEVNQSHINTPYLDLKLKELRLTYELQEKTKQAKDEQRRIREEMRDEEQARREIARAKEEAEKEEARLSKAFEKAREEVAKASGDKLIKLNDKISKLEEQLKAAQEMKERAISRAQITKSGHVYIISNIGSFGKNVFKIGMTRRLEPTDRIRELGDASVPFSYDIHTMIYSDNAPDLEYKLHKQFETCRLNLVNPRREFFTASLDDIEKWARQEGIDLQLTTMAEAREYRESMAIRMKGEESVKQAVHDIPESIDNLFSDEEDEAEVSN